MHDEHGTLRRTMREQRRALPAATRIGAAEALADNLLSLPTLPDSGHVAGYWAVDGEIGLHAWQLRLPASLIYCLPILHDDRSLRFAPWRPGAGLVSNRYGIPEPDVTDSELLRPEDMVLVVLPVVAFDAQCRRVGMGGGWYDRSFAFRKQCEAPPLLVGAAFAMQHVDMLSMADWDVPLDAVCTEGRIFMSTTHATDDNESA